MKFVPDDKDAPPYKSGSPATAFNETRGTTFYHVTPTGTYMRERYESFCIPVFGDPTASMGVENHYSCDFINRPDLISYVVLHADRPKGLATWSLFCADLS